MRPRNPIRHWSRSQTRPPTPARSHPHSDDRVTGREGVIPRPCISGATYAPGIGTCACTLTHITSNDARIHACARPQPPTPAHPPARALASTHAGGSDRRAQALQVGPSRSACPRAFGPDWHRPWPGASESKGSVGRLSGGVGHRRPVCRLHPPHPARWTAPRRRGCLIRAGPLAGRSITEGGWAGAKIEAAAPTRDA